MSESPTLVHEPLPPAYGDLTTATTTTVQARYTICDLRAQILANAAMFVPNAGRVPDGNIDLAVSMTSSAGPSRARDAKRPGDAPMSGGQHHALLWVGTNGGSSKRIVIKGEPRASVLEALEWMLEESERRIEGSWYGLECFEITCSI